MACPKLGNIGDLLDRSRRVSLVNGTQNQSEPVESIYFITKLTDQKETYGWRKQAGSLEFVPLFGHIFFSGGGSENPSGCSEK